jgi:hypothetical protein
VPIIQLTYPNTFETIWEYEEAFLSKRIPFPSIIGLACPLCGRESFYRQITPYHRYAIDLFPEFKKKRIPIARFLCQEQQKTFSLLPIQLIPYFQYTLSAILGTLLLGWECRKQGQRGFHGASLQLDPESLVTPWLIAFWLTVILKGLRRAHPVLSRWFDLTSIDTSREAWTEISDYFFCLRWISPHPRIAEVLLPYSRTTKHFLFGLPSQLRR